MSVSAIFQRADRFEIRLCLKVNGYCGLRFVRNVFRLISRLGDGWVWYALIVMMPLLIGLNKTQLGLRVSFRMAFAGAVGVTIYKLLKICLVRERPYIGFSAIECAIPPLDRYSFPSGHTLHAVLFTTLACQSVPDLAYLLVPFAGLVAASRIILGLHYPSDVMVGAALGWVIARLSEIAFPL